MSKTVWQKCDTCKGKGGFWVYENEWVEMWERLTFWWQRVTRRFRKLPPVKPTGTVSMLSNTSAGIEPAFKLPQRRFRATGCEGCAFIKEPDDHPNCKQCWSDPSPDFPGWTPRP